MKARRLLIAVIAVGALVAAGCGGDRGEDESGDTDTTATDTTEAAAGGGAGDFGDLTGVCGPIEGGGAVTADPAETQGITEDSITGGTVAHPGFEGLPGLNQEIFDAGTAFVEWCNAAGGINGKQLTLNLRDAAITEYQPVLQESCDEDFGIVGSGAVQDNFWPEVGAACGLIDIAGFSVTPDKAGHVGRDPVDARSFQPGPNPSDLYQVGSYVMVDEEYPDAPARTGILYGDLETTAIQAERVQAGLKENGHTIVHTAAYNILGESNWAPFAQALQEDDVQWLQFVGTGDNLALLLQAMWGTATDRMGARRPTHKLFTMAVLCLLSAFVIVPTFAGPGGTARWWLSACLWAAAPVPAWPQAVPPATATLELGREVFLRKAVPACAVCHTLEAAAASGAVGPVLDELRPDAQRVPKAVRNGLGAMPPFQGVLSDAEIEAVAAYVAASTGAAR